MALAATGVWEQRSDGADTNGGYYDSALSGAGTDYSQQAAAQLAITDVACAGGGSVTITSATAGFTAAMVGNGIYLTGGGATTGWYVMTVYNSASSFDLDRTPGGIAGGTGNVGGAIKRLDSILGTTQVAVAGNVVYCRGGMTTSNTTTQTLGADGTVEALIWIIGYTAGGSRSNIDIAESAMPIFTTATNSIAKFTLTGANYLAFRNIKVTDTAATRGHGWVSLTTGSDSITHINCVCDGCLSGWMYSSANVLRLVAVGCVARNCTGTGSNAGWFNGNATALAIFINCVCEDNANDGWTFGNGTWCFFNCVADTNARDGVRMTNIAGKLVCVNCTFYANVAAHIHVATTAMSMVELFNNIFYGCAAGTALLCDTASVAALFVQLGNAFGGNGTDRNNFGTGYGDITLSGDPFTNAVSNDFSIDNVASEGALLRGTAYPLKLGLYDDATATYLDVGAAQVQLTAGGGGPLVGGRLVRV